jgi:hypothetical protein
VELNERNASSFFSRRNVSLRMENYEGEENFAEKYEEDYEEDFNNAELSSLKHVLLVLLRYVLYGGLVAILVKYAPEYGQTISNSELMVIGAVAAGVILIGERILPKTSTMALKLTRVHRSTARNVSTTQNK